MDFDTTWRSIREQLSSLDRDTVLVTPEDERVFTLEAIGDEELRVRFRDDGGRTLTREAFDRLLAQLDGDGLALDSLPPGVGPYVSVLTLSPSIVLRSGHVRWATDDSNGGTASESPFQKSRWDVRRTPEKLHDDALLLAEVLERLNRTDIAALDEDGLVDLYVLLSDVQRGADDLRRNVGDELLGYVGPGGRIHGQYGTVSRAHRERRRLKDDATILDRLDEEGIPREWVLGVDADKLDLVVATTDVEQAEVYDLRDTYYVQKTGVETDAKRSRLQGLKDRLPTLPEEEAEGLREEIDRLEDRIEAVLAA